MLIDKLIVRRNTVELFGGLIILPPNERGLAAREKEKKERRFEYSRLGSKLISASDLVRLRERVLGGKTVKK